jgi:putative endonuclease
MFYVYILLLNNGNLYTGFTTDLKKRYPQHQSGGVESTRNRRPVKLVHYEAYVLEEDARRREKFLKTSDGKLFLRRQLSALFKKIGKYDKYQEIIE